VYLPPALGDLTEIFVLLPPFFSKNLQNKTFSEWVTDFSTTSAGPSPTFLADSSLEWYINLPLGVLESFF
jgi:hypothetical protein